MKLEELEQFRNNDGRIHVDKNIFKELVQKEDRGSIRGEKNWYNFDDGTVMIREVGEIAKKGAIFTDYQELLFEEIAKQVDMPTAHYDLCEIDGRNAVLTYNVLNGRKNASLSSLKDLINQKREYDGKEKEKDYMYSYEIEEAFGAMNLFARTDNIPKKNRDEMLTSFLKMQILDLFTCSTDRHPENIAFVMETNEKGEKKVGLSPLFDNELSLGSDKTISEIEDLMKDKEALNEQVEMLIQCGNPPENIEENNLELDIGIPTKGSLVEYIMDRTLKRLNDEKNGIKDVSRVRYEIVDENDKVIKPKTQSEKIFEYILEFGDGHEEIGDEVSDFVISCQENIDMKKAIESVEKRIGRGLPQIYKEYVTAVFDSRKQVIDRAYNEFYYGDSGMIDYLNGKSKIEPDDVGGDLSDI